MKMKINKIKLIKYIQPFLPRVAANLAFNEYIKAPKTALRELEKSTMAEANVSYLKINNKNIKTYKWGEAGRLILLVHGWGSRASRFYFIIKELKKLGFKLVAFDAPGHGASDGNTTDVNEIHKIVKNIAQNEGTFYGIIAHSLGVLYAMNALKRDIMTQKLVAISGVCELEYTIKNFARKFDFNETIHEGIKEKLEHYFSGEVDIWNAFSAHTPPKIKTKQMLIIHDKNDEEVDFKQSLIINNAYKDNTNLYFTDSLGHLRIMLDKNVLGQITKFLLN